MPCETCCFSLRCLAGEVPFDERLDCSSCDRSIFAVYESCHPARYYVAHCSPSMYQREPLTEGVTQCPFCRPWDWSIGRVFEDVSTGERVSVEQLRERQPLPAYTYRFFR